MKKKYFLFAALILASLSIFAQNKVTIKGNVKFIEEGFKVTVFQRSGTTRTVLAETAVNPDHTYSVEVPVNMPGEAIVDCGQWQSVNVWLEDENLDIDFRGLDTAKVKIKNPPYVHIRGGKNNEVMNLINFESYRAYQRMIAISQATYRAKIEDEGYDACLQRSVAGFKVKGNKVEVRFKHAEGLKTTNGAAPVGFELAGSNRQYAPATAELAGDKVILTADEIKSPRYMRYGWAVFLNPNLVNEADLPAAPCPETDGKVQKKGKKGKKKKN